MAEYFRQFAFIGSLLAGFSFAFFGTLLGVPHAHRLVGPAAALALAASTCFLVVTLGDAFAAAVVSDATGAVVSGPLGAAAIRERGAMLAAVGAHQIPISSIFLLGTVLLLLSFGAAGWVRSRRLGLATTAIAALGLVGVVWVLGPFVVRM